MSEYVITFVKNHSPKETEFRGTEKIFSFPYTRILDATEFCKREKLSHVYIGFKKGRWILDTEETGLKFPIKITQSGMDPEVGRKYVYTINDISNVTVQP
jgi:hypothetical protein